MPYYKREKILDRIKEHKYNLIAIDGYTSFGKSKLASFIAREADYKVIHLDKFLSKDKKNYLQDVDIKALVNEISNYKKVVIEGVFMYKILNKLDLKEDLFIFCVNDDFITEWKYYVDNEKDFNSLIKERVNNLNVIRNLEGKPPVKTIDPFHYELDKYIFDYMPFLNADILYDYSQELTE